MLSRRFALVASLIALTGYLLVSPAIADNHGDKSADFIRSLADNAIQSLTDPDTPRSERIDRFRVMFNDSFAVRSIAKRALGRHWRRASDDERTRYRKLFEDLMVVTYVDRFATYAGESLDVSNARIEDKAIATVFSQIQRRGGAKPIRVDWIVGTNGTIYKIVDVKVEGVSMTRTLSSDFGSIIRRDQRGIAGLLDELEKKTTALMAEN